jgi:hypothetical protein
VIRCVLISSIINNLNTNKRVQLKELDFFENYYTPVKELDLYTQNYDTLIGLTVDKKNGDILTFGKRLNYEFIEKGYPILKIYDEMNPTSLLPFTRNLTVSTNIFTNEKNSEYRFPYNEIPYFDTPFLSSFSIKSYSIKTNENNLVKTVRLNKSDYRCIRANFNEKNDLFLMFVESFDKNNTRFGYIKGESKKEENSKEEPEKISFGYDGAFIGSSNDYLILDSNKKSIKYFKNNSQEKIIELSTSIERIFTNLLDEKVIVYYNPDNNVLGFADDNFDFKFGKYFYLRTNEKPLQIIFNNSGLIGLLTSDRVCILSKDLRLLSSTHSENRIKKIYFYHSIMWFGEVLFFNDDFRFINI